MNILGNITTATCVSIQPGEVLFLNMRESSAKHVDGKSRAELQQILNDAFGHEVKFILTCDITPSIVSINIE